MPFDRALNEDEGEDVRGEGEGLCRNICIDE
jgi:hypothetical protein